MFFTCRFCWVLTFFRVVVHVMFDMVVVERDVIFVFACCGKYGTSTMPSTSFIRCHHTVAHYVSFAHSFDFFCFCFGIFANCSSCCCGFLFRLCFPCFTFCLRCGIICGGAFFFFFKKNLNDLLVFFRAQASRLPCFSAWSRSSYWIVSCFLLVFLIWMFFSSMVIMKVAMTHLWSLPMCMSLASASLACLKYLLLVRM